MEEYKDQTQLHVTFSANDLDATGDFSIITGGDGASYGKLDFTHISMSSTRKFTFAQGEPELPSSYIVPEPVEETPAEEGVTGETAEGTATDGTAPAEGEAAADAAAETPTDTAAAPADPEAGPTAQPTPAEGTTPAAGDANQPQTTQ